MDFKGQINKYVTRLQELLSDKEYQKGVENLADVLIQVYHQKGSVYIFGNGGSGMAASHMAQDWNKGTKVGQKDRMRVICLNDNVASILAYGNDQTFEDIFKEQLDTHLRDDQKDLVVAISGSGNSKNIVKAIEFAKSRKTKTFGLSGFKPDNKLRMLADTSLYVPSCDMQNVEDAHYVACHCALQLFCSYLKLSVSKCVDDYNL